MGFSLGSFNPFRGNPVKRVAKQFTGKKIMNTARAATKPVGKALGDIVSAPVRWSGDALHSANIMNDKAWRNNTDLANINGNIVQNAVSMPLTFGQKGGLAAAYHNPSSFLVDQELKDTSAYRNIARPVAKTAAALAIGYLTGGTAGLIMAGAGGAMGNHGSLSSEPFNPVTNVVAPAISGYAAGASASGQAFNAALDAGAGYGAAGSAALNAGTNGAVGASYNSAVETGLGAAGEQATTQGAASMGSQVAADMGAAAAPTTTQAATQAVAPTLLDQVAGYASTAGDYIGEGAKVANGVQKVVSTVNNVKDWINPQPDPVQPQTPQSQSPAVNAYQQPQYTVDNLVQLNSQAAANGGYSSAMQQERSKIMAALGVA